MTIALSDQCRRILSWVSMLLSLGVVVWAFYYASSQRNAVLVQQYRMQVFRDMIATTDHGLVILNPEGKIVEWGPGMTKIFGWSSAEVLGSSPEFMMPDEYLESHKKAISKEHPEFSRRLIDVDGWAYTKSGDLIQVHITAASFPNHIGYYHAALFTKQENVKTFVAKKPKDRKCLKTPEPRPIVSLIPEG